MFLVHLQQFLDVIPTSCPIVIIGHFNIDMFDQNSTEPNEFQTYLDHYSMELQEKKITTFIVLILIMCQQMPPFNNLCQ
jgi:hypothetical protein